MRRSPLKRHTPMKRGGRIRWKPPRRLKRPGSDPAYLAAVRTLPCAARSIPVATPCRGPMDPHHAGRRPGVGLKCDDKDAIPMCRGHHEDVEHLTGMFRHWTKPVRLAWYDEQIALTRAAIRGEA